MRCPQLNLRNANLKILQSFFAEILASFIFGYTVYTTILSVKFKDDPAISIAVTLGVGFSGVAIIYTFADHTISHFNPAITLAAILMKKLDPINGLGFIISQGIGFVIAALLAVVTFPGPYESIMEQILVGPGSKEASNVNIFFSEFILTAILVFVAFAVAVNATREPEKSLYEDEELPNRTIVAPLTTGLTLGFLTLLAAKSSGGCFNPGIAFAPMLLCGHWPYAWQYYVAEFAGGVVGAIIQVWILFK
ncbi:hypothetical protein PAEPH01_1768 [Pancytospora epiphaga]|nr:hypothetical protein PAEPH01_1768 [Pancytospora epiphaga]